jgi:hypothetical protein
MDTSLRSQEELHELVRERLTAPLQTLEGENVQLVIVITEIGPDGEFIPDAKSAVTGTVYDRVKVVALLVGGLQTLGAKFSLEQLRKFELIREES